MSHHSSLLIKLSFLTETLTNLYKYAMSVFEPHIICMASQEWSVKLNLA